MSIANGCFQAPELFVWENNIYVLLPYKQELHGEVAEMSNLPY